MLQITREATRYLLRTREERGLDARTGARFVRTPRGVGLTFVSGPDPHDRVVGNDALPIYLDDDIAAALDRSIIDVRNEDGQSRLSIRPQVVVG
jgi:hypothetical protein